MRRNYAKRRIVIPQRLVNALSELGESIVTEVSEEEGWKYPLASELGTDSGQINCCEASRELKNYLSFFDAG
jgi:hypothetical protein